VRLQLVLLAAAALVVPARAQDRPKLKKSLESEAAAWQDVLIRELREAQAAAKPDAVACEQCVAGLDFLKACKDIDVSKFKGTLKKAGECVDSCSFVQEGEAYDQAVKLRLADRACLDAALEPAAELAALDMGEEMTKEASAWTARCSECAPASFIRGLRRGLQDALDLVGPARAPKLEAAVAAVKKRQRGCAAPSDACAFKP
jgi:hypothetical protein